MNSGIVASGRVRLLEVDLDLGSLLTAEQLAEARQLAVPVVTIDRSDRDLKGLHNTNTFGALVLQGMVLRQLRVADQLGMRIHGPGDIVSLSDPVPPMIVVESSLDALPETRLALLGPEFLFAARRWPALISTLELRTAQQADRLAAQLVICQLPRVDQRLLSLLWLLAESWGRVTPAGTSLPLKLTHEALGALIGARRPTVTLALRELTERGAVIRQDDGWLLLEPPPAPSDRSEHIGPSAVIESVPSTWTAQADPVLAAALAAATEAADSAAAYAVLKETVANLRKQHAENRSRFDERLTEYALARERCRVSRTRISGERLTRLRRRSPSS